MCRSESRLALFPAKAKQKGETTKQAFFQRFRFPFFSHPTWNERAVVVRIHIWLILNPYHCYLQKSPEPTWLLFCKRNKAAAVAACRSFFQICCGVWKSIVWHIASVFFWRTSDLISRIVGDVSEPRLPPEAHDTDSVYDTRKVCVCTYICVYECICIHRYMRKTPLYLTTCNMCVWERVCVCALYECV